MKPGRKNVFGARTCGFTLIEALLALAVSAIVLAGIGGVFFSAIRLRERTTALLDESATLHHAMQVMKRDLKGVLPPGTLLAGNFICGNLSGTFGAGQGYGIEFSTSSGVIREEEPWGDIQEVIYELRDPEVQDPEGGKDLVRRVSRNLLTTATLEWEDQWLLGKVESLEFACYDGQEWRELWDTSMTETNLPTAVRVRINLASRDVIDKRSRQPIEMVIPLMTESRTNELQTAEGQL